MGAKSLTDDQVRQLRTRRVINKEYLADLALEFGISEGHALRLIRGEFRAAAGGPLDEGGRMPARRDMSGTSNPNSALQPEDKVLIRQLVADGARHQMVADVFRVSRASVTRIVNGKQLPNMKSYYKECNCKFSSYDPVAMDMHIREKTKDNPYHHFLSMDAVDWAAQGVICCYPGCSDPEPHVHYGEELPPVDPAAIAEWQEVKAYLDRQAELERDMREAVRRIGRVTESEPAPRRRFTPAATVLTGTHLSSEEPVPDDVRVYGEVTGRPVHNWDTWGLDRWRQEYEATGQSLAYDKMLAKVTLDMHSKLLDPPVAVPLPPGPRGAALLAVVCAAFIPVLAMLITAIVGG